MCFLAVWSLCSAPLNARTLDEVVVVGDRQAYAMGHSGAAVSVISRQDIVRHAWRTVSEALVSVPGLHVSSSGGPGAQTSVFMRGAESNHVLVLMNGVEISDPAGDHLVAFANLPLDQVESIEIIRGPYSSRYGSEALGGVINIITRHGGQTDEASVQLEYGSRDDRRGRLSLSVGDPHGSAKYFGGLSYWRIGGESHTPSRLRMGDSAENDSYRNADFYVSASDRLSDREQWRFHFNHNRARSEYDAGAAPYEARLSDYRNSRSARFELRGNYADGLWRPGWQLSHYRRDSRASAHRARGERFKMQWHNDLFAASGLQGAFGVETEIETIKGPHRENRRSNALYAQLSLSPSPSLLLDWGWRLDDAEHFSSARSWHFSGRHTWQKTATQLRFAYGTAFRAPSLSENFASWGNPDLRPERSRSWELGLEQWLAAERAHLGLTYFNNRLRDLIAYDRGLFNIGHADIEGAEFFIALKPAANFDLRFDYTWLSSHDQSHQRLLRRPIRKGTFDLAWSSHDYGLSLQLNHLGARDDISRSDFDTRTRSGGYTIAHVSAHHALNQTTRVFLRLSNILDKDYEPADGYQGESWAARLGFERLMRP